MFRLAMSCLDETSRIMPYVSFASLTASVNYSFVGYEATVCLEVERPAPTNDSEE